MHIPSLFIVSTPCHFLSRHMLCVHFDYSSLHTFYISVISFSIFMSTFQTIKHQQLFILHLLYHFPIRTDKIIRMSKIYFSENNLRFNITFWNKRFSPTFYFGCLLESAATRSPLRTTFLHFLPLMLFILNHMLKEYKGKFWKKNEEKSNFSSFFLVFLLLIYLYIETE